MLPAKIIIYWSDQPAEYGLLLAFHGLILIDGNRWVNLTVAEA
ncbi:MULTISPECIES: hypothetical protein [Moorena]|nr:MULTISPECIES: hypothetical protein [Moorena]